MRIYQAGFERFIKQLSIEKWTLIVSIFLSIIIMSTDVDKEAAHCSAVFLLGAYQSKSVCSM